MILDSLPLVPCHLAQRRTLCTRTDHLYQSVPCAIDPYRFFWLLYLIILSPNSGSHIWYGTFGPIGNLLALCLICPLLLVPGSSYSRDHPYFDLAYLPKHRNGQYIDSASFRLTTSVAGIISAGCRCVLRRFFTDSPVIIISITRRWWFLVSLCIDENFIWKLTHER
jgi:hypothetical protein